jgi:hypothetical protein
VCLQLGYGDNDEATVVAGGAATVKPITTYFRKAISISNAALINTATFSILRDDGAVVYVNGVEAFRTNMPTGTVSWTTVASSVVGGADETTNFYSFSVSPSLFVTGVNVIAVEIHQSGTSSSDISFDLELSFADPSPSSSSTPTPSASPSPSVSSVTFGPVVIPKKSAWKYLDNNSDQGTAWRTVAFSDAAWASGNAQVRRGDARRCWSCTLELELEVCAVVCSWATATATKRRWWLAALPRSSPSRRTSARRSRFPPALPSCTQV